jgi:hypothetical protein
MAADELRVPERFRGQLLAPRSSSWPGPRGLADILSPSADNCQRGTVPRSLGLVVTASAT